MIESTLEKPDARIAHGCDRKEGASGAGGCSIDPRPTGEFFRAADILSRVRSPISSRSNCANESRMFSVSLPSDVLVLNCWVTATKLTLCFSLVLLTCASQTRSASA